jgi:hypothetical protein
MTKPVAIRHVGAPDPERKTSPILEETSEEEPYGVELEPGLCYFNDVRYSAGQYVCSGDELLRCDPTGVWVRMGSCHPDIAP